MPQPIDVGAILGGRYKVTGRILASAEDDVILDGLDQVLNRPVSILVSAVANSENLTQSAREVAIGDRSSAVSILDLGTQDGSVYLIAARTTPADLLDLVVPTEPQEEVYQEPFFTDTLGTEIFGTARNAAPESAAYVYEDNSPLTPANPSPVIRAPAAPPKLAPKQAPKVTPAAVVPPAVVIPASVPEVTVVPTAAAPKVSLWSEDDYGFINEDHEANIDQSRKAGTFPAGILAASDNYDSDAADQDLDDDDANAPRTGGRWLTGSIVTILVAAALFFAITHIGTLFNGNNDVAAQTSPTTQAQASTGASKPSVAPAPPAVAPVISAITDITQYVPTAQQYGEMFIPRLPDAFDNNKATYWPTVEFSSDTFAGLTDSVDLAIELKDEATISSVTINQIAGSGGQFNILTNSSPSLEGAIKIGSGASFSTPDFTFKAPAGVKAKYVIISFTQLPKLQPYVTYPYGLKIAEISVK